MWQDIKGHLLHYLILFLILGLGFWGFWSFSYRPNLQRIIIASIVISYFLWGVIHHKLEGNLTYKIAIEYLSLAALAGGLLLLVIWGI